MTDRNPVPRPRDLERARRLARLLDRSFRIPGTSRRFGLDPLLGLLPVGGDLVGALASGYILYVAWRQGAPPALIARMLVNVGVDTVLGSVPLVGDLFDAGWKANVRNMRALDAWLGEEGTRASHSRLLLAGVAVALLVLVAGVALLAWLAMNALRR